MFSLLLIDETYTNGYKTEFLNVISLASILSGIFVIISKNPIVSVLFLIGLFLSIACYLFILGINFIGLSYLLVYVGAVSILFLFILMLINVRISELLNDTSSSIPLAMVIVISFNYSVYQILPINMLTMNASSFKSDFIDDLKFYLNDLNLNTKASEYIFMFFNFFSYNQSKQILYVTSKFWDGNLTETAHISSIGNIMYTSYSIWLVITSIILLLAMVGAIVITIKQKN
uniref:NADH-ubiquinone oxidoreductase chain 6 n=1 Tax=Cladonia subtenuis TaxID=195789 RepID=A0A385GNL9_9LECA|nr:NADH dehydrogenase subunit 6 [Cladonia subtenuis]AXX76236.1 NADH dehydrogenase subunit 6 [Cladonia subtenuis]WBP63538.1 NADH dehydrogenase subunit 6 [Cladonia subtenuis]WBP64226.1 NADH dehydrogenase subunit 6 [Cladonia subtenuis]